MAYTPLNTHLMIGSESVYGTEVATTTKIGTVKSINPDVNWNVYEVAGVGDGREVQNFLRIGFNARVSVVHEVHEFEFLKHAVGPLAGSGTTASHYTVTEADLTGVTSATHIIPFSMELGSEGATDDVDTYTGCFIDTVTLSGQLGGVLTSNMNVIAQKVTSSTSATAYTPFTTYPFTMTGEGSLKWGATPSAVTGIRSFSVTLGNTLKVFGDWGTVFISMPVAGPRRITWSATFVMEQAIATTLRDDFYGQANSPIDDVPEFTLNDELHVDFSQGDSSGDRKAQLRLDQCIIERIGKPINWGSDDVVLVSFSGRAKTSKSNVFAEWWTVT